MSDNRKEIDQFWHWFHRVAAMLAADGENASLLQELDARIHQLDQKLSWEIGPGSHEPWQLVISPNLDVQLWDRAREIISRAPVVEGWEFHPARRPKDWDYKLVMERAAGERLKLDASAWNFVLLQYADGTREVLLQGNDLPPLDDDERWQAAAIVLESILGEEPLMGQIREFELLDELEPQFAEKQKPIQHLRDVVFGT
jgi:hypothetical protein